MLTITCPFCGPRSENEFVHGGPARIQRPENSGDYASQAWVDYLTHQPNPVGVVNEMWWHVRGCGSWVTIQRDTLTHVIVTDNNEPAHDRQNDTKNNDSAS